MVTVTRDHSYQKKPLTANAMDVLRRYSKRLKCAWWLNAGTCLGLYRDGQLIENDSDIDVAVEGHPFIERDIRRWFSDFNPVRVMHWQHGVRGVKRCVQVMYEIEGCGFDIYIYYPVNGMMTNCSERGVVRIPKDYCLRPEVIDGLNYPDPTEVFLEIRYGSDWRIPAEKPGIYQKEYGVGLCFGTFDPLHYGHIRLFERAAAMCEKVIVSADADNLIRRVKKREPAIPYRRRMQDLNAIKYVSYIVNEDTSHPKSRITKEVKPDVLIKGDDRSPDEWPGQKLADNAGIHVEYVPHTRGIHSGDMI